MQDIRQNLCTAERLTFDELYISNRIDLEQKKQKIYGPYKTCQFVMAKKLFSKF